MRNNTATLEQIIMDTINQLSPHQINQTIATILEKQASQEVDPDENIKETIDQWNQNETRSSGSLIDQTFTKFHDFFSSSPFKIDAIILESIKPDSPFANNLKNNAITDPSRTKLTMQLFCRYISILSTKDRETASHFLQSFPPQIIRRNSMSRWIWHKNI
ncbi:MAG: hypothetical protein ISQ34_05260 [Rickettsiales bacterium]|nr:hypothetical protein [Rickettsiales bacterium]